MEFRTTNTPPQSLRIDQTESRWGCRKALWKPSSQTDKPCTATLEER